LNGTHSFSCGLAVLAGFNTVKAAMADPVFGNFVTNLMRNEIVPAITGEEINLPDAEHFSAQVIDRFRNPFIEHEWLNITLEYSSKMMMRNVPILQKYFRNRNDAPTLMTLGFAGYLLFMKSDQDENGQYYGHIDGHTYLIRDSRAALVCHKWKEAGAAGVANAVLCDEELWGVNLTSFPGFSEAVTKQLEMFLQQGVYKTIAEALNNHSVNT
jgi:tagaturonate reductase